MSTEAARLAALRSYEILDSDDDAERFDRITRLAAQILDVPIALVSLIDADRQWFKSRIGLEPRETARAVAFCDHAIRGDATMVVENATEDARFRDNPLVTGDPNIRFYAGAPLVTPGGHRVGTLCVIDSQVRSMPATKLEMLGELAAIVVEAMEQRKAARAHARSREDLVRLLDALPLGVLIRREGPTLYSNPELLRIAGATEPEVFRATPIEHFVHADDHPKIQARRAALLAGGPPATIDLRLLRGDGTTCVVAATAVIVDYEAAPAVATMLLDVTEQRAASEALARSALFDPLTGVSNRRGGEEAARRDVARSRRSQEPLSIVVVDIDHFKRVNDVHGHAVGDEVIKRVADALVSEARLTDTVIRWGGEEFVVIAPGPVTGAVTFAERVRAAIAGADTPAGKITVSCGVTELRDREDLDAAFPRADAALYRAKQGGRDQVCIG